MTVLKGQHNLAQGNALGLKEIERIVRAMAFFKEKSLFRTITTHSFKWSKILQFRPKMGFCLVFYDLSGGFRCVSFTQDVAVRLSAHAEALG